MIYLKDLNILETKLALNSIPDGKILINTINAHSYNVAQKDNAFAEALIQGDYLIPDGSSVVKACPWLKAKSHPKERIAGWDLFAFEMQRLNGTTDSRNNGIKEERKKVMFMGSSEKVLSLIREKAAVDYLINQSSLMRIMLLLSKPLTMRILTCYG